MSHNESHAIGNELEDNNQNIHRMSCYSVTSEIFWIKYERPVNCVQKERVGSCKLKQNPYYSMKLVQFLRSKFLS